MGAMTAGPDGETTRAASPRKARPGARRPVLPAILGLLLSAAGAGAQTPPDLVAASAPEIKALAGAWDVTAVASSKRCRIQLNGAQPGREQLVAGIQPPCRVAIPALTPVLAWGLGKDGRIHLLAGDGRTVLAFQGRPAEKGGLRFLAGPAGGEIALEATEQRYEAGRRNAAVAAALTAVQAPATGTADPAAAAAAGRYTVTRDPKQPGCVVTLALEPATIEKARKATLDPACADAGLKVFDPAGWRMEGERLFLVARKGHTIGFSRTREGHLFKDPPQGRPLLMVKS